MSSAYDPAVWADFGVAIAGAAAALTGLLFVAVSINLERILAQPGLPRRAGSTLILLILPLLTAIVLLVPGQPTSALSVELLALGLVVGAVLVGFNRPGTTTGQEPAGSWLLARFVPSVLCGVFTVAAGASLLADAGGGLYWIAPAVVLAFAAGIGNAWVLLVEILR